MAWPGNLDQRQHRDNGADGHHWWSPRGRSLGDADFPTIVVAGARESERKVVTSHDLPLGAAL